MNFNTLQEDWGSVKPKELSLRASSSLLPVSLLSLGLKLLEESIGSSLGVASREDGGRQAYFSFVSLRKRDPGGGNRGQSFNRGRGAVPVLGIYDRNGAEPWTLLGRTFALRAVGCKALESHWHCSSLLLIIRLHRISQW